MSDNAQPTNESNWVFWLLLWALAPSVATIAIFITGLTLGAPPAVVYATAALVAFALAYAWSLSMLSRTSLSESARLWVALPVALGLLFLNACATMFGCSVMFSSMTGVAPP